MTHNMVAALQRLNGREMLVSPETADEFVANLARFTETDAAAGVAAAAASRETLCMTYGIDDRREGQDRKEFVYQDGIAVIPVHGTLINRFGGSWGFVTGYNFIRRQLNLILDDEDVDSFVFDVNTPGGEASGCFELAREIFASRRVKPSLAMVDSLMASGGMAIGGAATKVYAIPSARIGSIGVYRQHVSVEGAMQQQGVKITFAQAGEHKTDGQPYKDLPDAVLRDWTKDVNKTWDDFITLVAETRGMQPEDVRATQARIYRADEALALGLINDVKTTTEAVPAFVAELAEDNPNDDEEEVGMTTETKGKTPEATSGVDYGKIGSMISEGITTAMTAMFGAQSRATAIRDHGKAKGQVALAAKLSANDKISEAEAIEMIDAAAVKSAPKSNVKAKGKKARVSTPTEDAIDDEDEDEDGGENEDEDGGENEDEDGGEQEARANRRSDNVNHLDRAMGGQRRERVGGGNSNDSTGAPKGDAADTATLLGDYAAHTGTDLRPAK